MSFHAIAFRLVSDSLLFATRDTPGRAAPCWQGETLGETLEPGQVEQFLRHLAADIENLSAEGGKPSRVPLPRLLQALSLPYIDANAVVDKVQSLLEEILGPDPASAPATTCTNPACRAENPLQRKFCRRCGWRLLPALPEAPSAAASPATSLAPPVPAVGSPVLTPPPAPPGPAAIAAPAPSPAPAHMPTRTSGTGPDRNAASSPGIPSPTPAAPTPPPGTDLRTAGARHIDLEEFLPSDRLGSAPTPPIFRAGGRFEKHDSAFGVAAASPATPNATIVRVFYATDRLQLPTWNAGPKYDKRRAVLGKLHFGACEISIPKTHKKGTLETPSILHFEFRPNPEKHIVLTKTFTLVEELFFDQVRSSVSQSAKKDAFIFVHGYNVSFEDAARRTGQIAFDLEFTGAPIFYSWPSNGRFGDYLKDETNVAWSAPHLEAFLSVLSERTGAERIHVIAHSMGNRAVCEALKSLSHDPACRLKLNHLVLAAPDIDADTFAELAGMLKRLSHRVTLYESSNDKAIHASKKLHGNPRAGEPLLLIPGVDTIDVSAVDTNFLGHSYFSDNWPLLSDINSILSRDEAPGARFGLTTINNTAGIYYSFRA